MPRSFRDMVSEAKQQITEISAEEVERRRASGDDLLVVDVREKEDYGQGHIEGAVNIPRGLLELNIDEHTREEEKPIVLYCGGGSRSALSAKTLQEVGYRNVMSLQGGFRGWKEAGRSTETE